MKQKRKNRFQKKVSTYNKKNKSQNRNQKKIQLYITIIKPGETKGHIMRKL